MRNRLLLAFAAAAIALPSAAAAQNSATIEATATVLDPITVAFVQDLAFGEVIPGFPLTVAPADANAGQFQISGGSTAEVDLDFGTLITALDGPGAATLPITFGAADAGFGATAATVDGTFDPNVGTTANLVTGNLFVFLGGTVTPGAVQTPGAYSGDVTLTVTYTGN